MSGLLLYWYLVLPNAIIRVMKCMATMEDRLVFLDTNILLAATNQAHREHRKIVSLLPALMTAGIHGVLCGQVLREYLVVASRPIEVNGLGMASENALVNAKWFKSRSVFFEEDERVWDALASLVHTHRLEGKRIHDANIAAVMAVQGIQTIISLNIRDFDVFGHLEALSPEEAGRRLLAL